MSIGLYCLGFYTSRKENYHIKLKPLGTAPNIATCHTEKNKSQVSTNAILVHDLVAEKIQSPQNTLHSSSYIPTFTSKIMDFKKLHLYLLVVRTYMHSYL